MTLAVDHECRAFNGLAIVTGGAALAALMLLTASLISLSHATTDATPTFSRFDRSSGVLQHSPMVVAAPAFGGNP